MVKPGSRFFKVPACTGPKKLFLVCCVYNEDQNMNIFEAQIVKISGKETDCTVFLSKDLHYFIIWLARYLYGFKSIQLPRLSRNEPFLSLGAIKWDLRPFPDSA